MDGITWCCNFHYFYQFLSTDDQQTICNHDVLAEKNTSGFGNFNSRSEIVQILQFWRKQWWFFSRFWERRPVRFFWNEVLIVYCIIASLTIFCIIASFTIYCIIDYILYYCIIDYVFFLLSLTFCKWFITTTGGGHATSIMKIIHSNI